MTKASTLKKMTAIKLREMAGQFEEIQGASGLNKEQLVATISEALKKRGQLEDETPHSQELDQLEKDRTKFKPEIQTLIREKKALLAAAEHDHAKLKEVREKIKRLRRRIHRIMIREEQLKKMLKKKA